MAAIGRNCEKGIYEGVLRYCVVAYLRPARIPSQAAFDYRLKWEIRLSPLTS